MLDFIPRMSHNTLMMKIKDILEYVVKVAALVAFLALAASNKLSFGVLSYYM